MPTRRSYLRMISSASLLAIAGCTGENNQNDDSGGNPDNSNGLEALDTKKETASDYDEVRSELTNAISDYDRGMELAGQENFTDAERFFRDANRALNPLEDDFIEFATDVGVTYGEHQEVDSVLDQIQEVIIAYSLAADQKHRQAQKAANGNDVASAFVQEDSSVVADVQGAEIPSEHDFRNLLPDPQ